MYKISREPRIQYISIVNQKKLTLDFLMTHEAIEKKQKTAGKNTVKHTVAGRRCGSVVSRATTKDFVGGCTVTWGGGHARFWR